MLRSCLPVLYCTYSYVSTDSYMLLDPAGVDRVLVASFGVGLRHCARQRFQIGPASLRCILAETHRRRLHPPVPCTEQTEAQAFF